MMEGSTVESDQMLDGSSSSSPPSSPKSYNKSSSLPYPFLPFQSYTSPSVLPASHFSSFSVVSDSPHRFSRSSFARLGGSSHGVVSLLPCLSTKSSPRRLALVGVIVAAACVLVVLSIYLGVVAYSLRHHFIRLSSIDSIQVDHLCNSSWSIAASATTYNPTYNDISLDDVEAGIVLILALDIELIAGDLTTAEQCMASVSALVNSSLGGSAASLNSTSVITDLLVTETVVFFTLADKIATAAVIDSTLIRTGAASLGMDIVVVPQVSQAQQMLVALSNLTDVAQQIQDGWQQFQGCDNHTATITLTAGADVNMAAVARATVLSKSYSERLGYTFHVTLLTQQSTFASGSAAIAAAGDGSALSEALSATTTTGINSLSFQWTNISAQLFEQQVSASTVLAAAGSLAAGSLPLGGFVTIALPAALQWDVQYNNAPLGTLLVQPATMTADASVDTTSTLDITLNTILTANVTHPDVDAWHVLLQAALDADELPSLSSFSFFPTTFASSASCTLASLIDTRYIRSSAIQYFLNTSSTPSSSSSAAGVNSDTATALSQPVSLSGTRLIALSVGGADNNDYLAIELTADFYQSSLGQLDVMVEGELPGLSVLLNTTESGNSSAAALSLQPLPLTAGDYRMTFALRVAVFDEFVVNEQLMPALVNGIDSSSPPLALGLTLKATDGDTSVIGTILSGLTLAHSIDSYDGLCRSWSSVLTLESFNVNSNTTTADLLSLSAHIAYDWVNIVQLPSLTFAVDVDAFASADSLLQDEVGSLSLQFSTLLGWPSQTLQIDAQLSLPSTANCSSHNWLHWQNDLSTTPLSANSPCWQSYYVGQFVRNLPFDYPLLLRATVGAFSVTFPYNSFMDTSEHVPPSLLSMPNATSYGCDGVGSSSNSGGSNNSVGEVVGVVSTHVAYSGVSNGSVEWWMPVELRGSTPFLLIGLPVAVSSPLTWLVRDIVQYAALDTPATLTASDARWSQLELLGEEAAAGSLAALVDEAVKGSFCVPVYNYSYMFTVLVADVFILPITATAVGG